MPDPYPPSELGGKTQRNGIQPPITPTGHKGHSPTPAERLRLLSLTGQDEDSTKDPDTGEAFTGMAPLDEVLADLPVHEKAIDAGEW